MKFGNRLNRCSIGGKTLLSICRKAVMIGEDERGKTMIKDTLSNIEARLQSTDAISEDKRRELQELLSRLKSEVDELSKTHSEQAESIAGFTEMSAHEATREQQNPRLLKLSLDGLTSSVEEFEKSHPTLVQVVNAISNTLSNLGI